MNPETASPSIVRRARHAAKVTLRMATQKRTTKQRIVADLRALGVEPGGILMVHSSLSALGYVPGGTVVVIDAVQDVVGPEGTLVMPTHSWSQMSKGCRTFDARHTRSCVGQITEQFRRMPSVVRSLHPTHSVAACGPLAEMLVADHEQSETPCGEGTPYARMMQRDAQILLLGVGTLANTAFHALEAMAGVPYLLQDSPETFTIVDASGARREIHIRRHRPGVARRFPEMEEILVREGVARRGPVGQGKSVLIGGRALRDFMREKLREDPGFLLAERESADGKTVHGVATVLNE